MASVYALRRNNAHPKIMSPAGDILEACRLACLPTAGRNRVKLDVIASRIGMAAPTLYGILDGRAPLLARHIVDICRATGDTLPCEALALQCGLMVSRMPHSHGDGTPMSELANVIREHADIPRVVLHMIAPDSDGGESATAHELKALDRNIAELVSALVSLRASVAASVSTTAPSPSGVHPATTPRRKQAPRSAGAAPITV